MALQKLANEQGYLKAGFLGYQKSGKSYTATKLAIGVRQYFKLQGPIAFYDTEAGSGYLAEMVRKETSLDLLGVRARSFAGLMQFADDCIKERVSVAIVDSITHPWRELCDSYLAQLNEKRTAKGWQKLAKLEFQHWGEIKALWEPWTTFFLNSPLHMIICGRAGAIWEFEQNVETGRKELIKAGTKMKTETEFGFEPSLLVEMERDQVPDGQGGFKLTHIATVIGDRFGVLDGKTETNPSFEFFMPHIAMLRAGAHAPVNTTGKTATGADIEGGDFDKERKQRTIYCEEIQGAIVSKYPGQSAEEKKVKAELLQAVFGTRSWTRVESMNSADLRDGLERLRKHLGIDQPVSQIDTLDALDFGGPIKPQEPPAPVSTPPTPEKPAISLAGDAAVALEKLRAVMKAGGELSEARLVQLLKNLGSINQDVNSLVQVAIVKPSLLSVIADNWSTYVAAAAQWEDPK